MKNGLKKLKSSDSRNNLYIMGDIIEKVRVGMISTVGADTVPSSRPMYVQEVDELGQIWFFTSTTSHLVERIRANPTVHITFADTDKNKFLTAIAHATEVHDRAKMQELWNPTLKAWFKDGLETPDIVLLKLQPEQAEYWDSPNSAVVRIFGFVKALVSDEPYAPGRHEKVNFQSPPMRKHTTEKTAPAMGDEQAP